MNKNVLIFFSFLININFCEERFRISIIKILKEEGEKESIKLI